MFVRLSAQTRSEITMNYVIMSRNYASKRINIDLYLSSTNYNNFKVTLRELSSATDNQTTQGKKSCINERKKH